MSSIHKGKSKGNSIAKVEDPFDTTAPKLEINYCIQSVTYLKNISKTNSEIISSISFNLCIIVKSFIYFAGNLASNQKMHVELVHLGLKKYKSEICHKTFGQAGAAPRALMRNNLL